MKVFLEFLAVTDDRSLVILKRPSGRRFGATQNSTHPLTPMVRHLNRTVGVAALHHASAEQVGSRRTCSGITVGYDKALWVTRLNRIGGCLGQPRVILGVTLQQLGTEQVTRFYRAVVLEFSELSGVR